MKKLINREAGGQAGLLNSRKSLVSSREFDNEKILARSAHNELTSNYSRLTTKIAFTMAGAGQRAPLFGWLANGRVAFTMAEILLSLTIIGVVAAITLPSLTGNINERTWTTQRKALYSRMTQAIALMPALNGYGTFHAESSEGAGDGVDNAAETFVSAGLAKVLKINNICDGNHLSDCGLSPKFILLSGIKVDFPTKMSELNPLMMNVLSADTMAAGFETANGESVAIYYNPYCASDLHETTSFWSQPKMCANFVFDLNGKKGPNTIGKDMGVMTALYATDSVVVMPIPTTADPSRDSVFPMRLNINNKCTAIDPDSRIPNREELASMFYNRYLVSFNYNSESGGNTVGDYWATPLQPTSASAFCLRMTSGQWLLGCTAGNGSARCVKR